MRAEQPQSGGSQGSFASRPPQLQLSASLLSMRVMVSEQRGRNVLRPLFTEHGRFLSKVLKTEFPGLVHELSTMWNAPRLSK